MQSSEQQASTEKQQQILAERFAGQHSEEEGRRNVLVQTRLNIIFSWDFTRVKMLLTRDHGLDATEAERRIGEYRKYMAINAVFVSAHHPISKEIDEVWHCHVLDTPDYARFSAAVFGRFVHHNPVFTEAEQRWLAEKYEANTLPHLRALFGEPSAKYWLEVRLICWGEGGGGNCS